MVRLGNPIVRCTVGFLSIWGTLKRGIGQVEERFSLKDALFNRQKVAYLAGLLMAADTRFDGVGFERDVMAELLSLELKQRIDLIARVLVVYLPADFDAAVAVILRALPPELDPLKTDDDFGDFIFAPFGEYVSSHGLDHFDRSMDAICALTKRFSMEFTLRHFLNAHEPQVMAILVDWAVDENYHLRRLVSEGTRPRLPWGKKVGLTFGAPLPLLDQLYCDPTRYVTRSVANHLNDIAKLDAGLVVETLARWQGEGRQDPREMDWIIRHALRTLIKKGDPQAMALLGYVPEPPIAVSPLKVTTPSIVFGDAFEFEVTLTAHAPAKLLVDYAIGFVKADGQRKAKVFKLKQLSLKAGETVVLRKRHRLKADATTYRLYAGTQGIFLQINGVERGSSAFDLTET